MVRSILSPVASIIGWTLVTIVEIITAHDSCEAIVLLRVYSKNPIPFKYKP